jgi:hypothetical protein
MTTRGDPVRISSALAATGVETETSNEKIRTEMAYGMFDTRGKVSRKQSSICCKTTAYTGD